MSARRLWGRRPARAHMRGRHAAAGGGGLSFGAWTGGRAFCATWSCRPGNAIERYPHHWMHIGQLGDFTRHARAAGCRDVVFIGSLVRPTLWNLRPDFKALSYCRELWLRTAEAIIICCRAWAGWSRITAFTFLAPMKLRRILVPEGVLGRVAGNERDRQDIAFGFDYLRASGAFDIGQAVVVAGKRVLAVEAAEGTDQMLARVAEMRAKAGCRSARDWRTGEGAKTGAGPPI